MPAESVLKVKHWTLGESSGAYPGFSMYACQMSHTSTGGVTKNPSAVARSKSHRRNLRPSTIQRINIKQRARPSWNRKYTDLSTAISRNHNHLPFTPIDLPMGGTTSATAGSEYGSSTFSWKSLKALSNLKWDLICSSETSDFFIFLVPILNIVKSRYEGGRVLEGPSFAGAGEGSGAFELGLGPGCNPGSGFWRKLKETEGLRCGFGCEVESGLGRNLGAEAEGFRCRLDCGVESGCCSSASEYGGGSSASAIAGRWVIVEAQVETRGVAMESRVFGCHCGNGCCRGPDL